MSDRRDSFDKLDEETERDIENYEVNEGIVDELVEQAREIIRNEDNHGVYPTGGGHRVGREDPAQPRALIGQISTPSKEVHSPDLSEALVRISRLQYENGDGIPRLKSNISSALLMKLDEIYPKHWEIRLGGQTFQGLFNRLLGVQSLHISDCPANSIGRGMTDIEYVCFENIEGNVGKDMESVDTAVFKNVSGKVLGATEKAVCSGVSDSVMVASDHLIVHDVPWTSVPGPRSLQVDNSRPHTAYVRKDRPSEGGNATLILYDAYAGVLVSQNAAETVRPLTDKEHQVIEELADDSPPDKQEVTDAIATLNKEADNDG